ncbi:hypothetical protein TNCV_2698891 [Trichonephila clavipes]|nr:hypothetical protein TNCV_2698891 [Trichonephila clavipes]
MTKFEHKPYVESSESRIPSSKHLGQQSCKNKFKREDFHINYSVTRENASQEAEIANDIYGIDTVTANYVQVWFRRFRSAISDFKDAPRTVGSSS